ncbi:MAG: phytanoyl-CoA dioxygenase family protein [Planctomycetota bacterium]
MTALLDQTAENETPFQTRNGVDGLALHPDARIVELSSPPTASELDDFAISGVGIARSLLSADEIAEVRDVFQAAGDQGPQEGVSDPKMLDENDAGRDAMLRRFPRMLQPHRKADSDFGRIALRWMLEDRITRVIRGLCDEEPIAAQSMYYFKGPGARGQSLHQDNFFLAVRPGTCIAAWIAVDDCDEENGAMAVVPGSGDWDLICNGSSSSTENADEFWGDSSLDLPPGVEPEVARMKAGDVLFFNGSLVHGSYRNRSADRFRRSLIFHYAPKSCRQISDFYHPVLALDGTPQTRESAIAGGPCGSSAQTVMMG